MGFDASCGSAAPTPSAPAYTPYTASPSASSPASPLDWNVNAELEKMGLVQWASQLASGGLTTMAAFRLVEHDDDLPVNVPPLVRKQIVQRASQLRESYGSAAEVTVHFKVISENRSFDLEVDASETLEHVRARFPPDVPKPNKVCFDGLQLEEGVRLAFGNVVQGSTLFIIPTSGGPMSIYVKTPSGSVCSISACPSTSFGSFASSVAASRKCHVSMVQLTFHGTPILDPNVPLGALGVTDGSVFKSLTELK
eukprot:TRINITY_DN24183_c0_g1_i1.p1 TRINITY_DN24183_c0_g1~~TRINITY_DN24183_c0_g1_i1.p1  ORF type:complete len:253 (+),score=26.85 TRINITY_DN24183_c0_g1_i1:66-824(+)